MVRIALAPCSPFSVSPELMREIGRPGPPARRAPAHPPGRNPGRKRLLPARSTAAGPWIFWSRSDWLAPDVWLAHGIWFDGRGDRPSGPGRRRHRPLPHVPTCGWVRASAGCAICGRPAARSGLAVDGSASNDSSHLLAELRQTLLLHRVIDGAGGHDRRRGPGDGHPRRRRLPGPRRRRRRSSRAGPAIWRSSIWRPSATTGPTIRWPPCCCAIRSPPGPWSSAENLIDTFDD